MRTIRNERDELRYVAQCPVCQWASLAKRCAEDATQALREHQRDSCGD